MPSKSLYVKLINNYTLYVIFWKKYVQRRPNANTAIVVFTKFYVERIFYFFCSRGWSIGVCFLHLLREDYRSSLKVEIFLPKGVSFYPSISPFTMRAYEGYACQSPLPINGEKGKSLRITRKRKYFVKDGYKRPRFFSIYYEGICRAPLKAPPSIMNKM